MLSTPFQTFPNTSGPIRVLYSPTLRGVCRGSGNRFAAKLQIDFVAGDLLPEYQSADAWLAAKSHESHLAEEWARLVHDEFKELVNPRCLTVRLISESGAVHAPITVTVESCQAQQAPCCQEQKQGKGA